MAADFKTLPTFSGAAGLMDGRAYFGRWGKAYKVESVDPDVLSASPPSNLKRGSAKSRVGGRIAHDLQRLEPSETQERQVLSEEFLKQPERHFPGE